MRRVQSANVGSEFTYEQMFKVATRQTSAFGIEGYEPPQKYADPIQQIKERENLKIKKGQKNRSYVTKRGHYLEDLKKITDGMPAPNKYNLIKQWVNEKQEKRAQSAPPKRSTFIDDIFKEQKLRAVPGSGKYNVQKPLDEVLKQVEEMKKKKIAASDRPTYLNELMWLADNNPGPGNYNPRPISKKLKIDQTKPKDMIAKHKKTDKRIKSAFPDVGTYKPEPTAYTTFSRLANVKYDKNKNVLPKDTRFKDPNKTKSSVKPVPGPGQYPLIVNWAGKEEGIKKINKRSYMDSTTKGIQRSIYY